MKLHCALLLLAGALPAAVPTAHAQNLVPVSLAGSLLTVSVAQGQPPFATNGTYRLITSAVGNDFAVLGRAGPFSSGRYEYAGSGATGQMTLIEVPSQLATDVALAFLSPTNGMLAITNVAGSQTGSFTLAPYARLSPPVLFLPGLVNGTQMQSFLSGQPGVVYGVETSADLAAWAPWITASLADLTTNVSDALGGAIRFYRARIHATAFAPADLTNRTLNLTILEGAAPLATNGICQWLASTNNDSYQIIGGPGTTNSSGTYVYTRTGPDSGLVSCRDSVAGTVSEQLVFTSPQSGYFYLTNGAGFEAGTFALADGPVEFLGHMKFTADTARAGSSYFAAAGSPATLSVTNAAGWVWTLQLPADALLTPRLITMTPFASVDAGNARLPVTAGVQFAPDGLRFSDGVTLTVTPPALPGSHAALLMADGDGSNLHFVSGTNQAGRLSTTLFHFSSAGVSDPSDQAWTDFRNSHLSEAEAAYQNAVRQCKSLERLVTVPPEPPDYDWKCDATDDEAQISAYQKALFAKEDEALAQLLGAARNLELLDEPINPDEFSVARELIETAKYRKVDSLFGRYNGNPKKFMAVTRVALEVAREDELMLGTGRPDWVQGITDWAKRVIDDAFDQLRNEHKYSKAVALPQIMKSLSVFTDVDANDFFTRLDNALTFKLTLDMTVSLSSEGFQPPLTVNGQGDATLKPQGHQFSTISGSGTFNYVSGSATTPGDCTITWTMESGHTFVATPNLDLEPCEQKLAITIPPWSTADTAWPEWWNWQITCPDGTSSSFGPIPWGQLAAGIAALDDIQPFGQFQFPLQDGQAAPVDQTVEGQPHIGDVSWDCQVRFHLQHTPQ